MVLGFVAVKYIFKQLGEDALGIIYFTNMINGLICVVLEMGICSTTVREVSAYFRSDTKYIENLIRTFSLFYWIAFVLLGVTIYFLSPILVEKWINLKTMDIATATFVLRALGISSLLSLPKSFYVSLFRGIQRMEFNNINDVITSGLQQFGTILILVAGGNLFHVVYWFIACHSFNILGYLICSLHFFSLKALLPGYSYDIVKRNFGFASRMLMTTIFSMVHTQVDKIIISKLLPIGVVGYYSIAYGSVSKGGLLGGAISQASFPAFSALSRAGNRNKLMIHYRMLQDFTCYTTVLLFAAIPFCVMPLFSFMFNEKVASLLLLPMTLLSVGFYMNGTLKIPYVFSLAVGKPGISARSNFYALFVVLPITVFLVYRWGLTGAGLSLILYHFFMYIYGIPKICIECLNFSFWTWYLHISKIFMLIGISYGSAWIAMAIIGNYSIPSLTAAYTGASIVFMTGSYLMIGEELRGRFSDAVQTLKAIFSKTT